MSTPGFTRRSFAAGAVSLLTAGVGLSAAAARLPGFRWPHGHRAAVSLTYDDGLDTQIDTVTPDLRAAGFKATFFLTEENMAERLGDWQGVFRQGHEVGNHSVTHPCDLTHCVGEVFREQEIAPMEAYLDKNFSAERLRTYAYPCGVTGIGDGALRQRVARYQHILKGRIAAARTIDGQINDPLRVAGDPFNLHGHQATWDVDDPERVFRYVRRATASGGWAILVFHDVVERREEAAHTSRATHQAVLKFLAAQPAWIAPMGEVFQYIVARTDPAAPSIAGRQPQLKGRARA